MHPLFRKEGKSAVSVAIGLIWRTLYQTPDVTAINTSAFSSRRAGRRAVSGGGGIRGFGRRELCGKMPRTVLDRRQRTHPFRGYRRVVVSG